MDDSITLRWEDARKVCQDKGANLVMIKSREENTFIWNLVEKQDTVAAYGAWIGLHREDDDKFYWDDDTLFYQGRDWLWRKGQPDNYLGKENCVHILERKWNDLPCDADGEMFKAPVIVCQKKM